MSSPPETYKSPYSLLNLSPAESASEDWAQLLRKKRKEILAEFDLHHASSLVLNGQSWTKSEVLSGFEELAQKNQTVHSVIWERGWMDFWQGTGAIPSNMANPVSWQGEFEPELYEEFEKLLAGRLTNLILHRQYTSILSLLSFSFAVPDNVLQKAESPISHLLLTENLEWIGRTFQIRPEGPEGSYQEWFPAMHGELFCLLPERYAQEGSKWAKSVIDTGIFLARYLTFEQRNEILILEYPANAYWPEDLKRKWNRFQQYLSIVPQADSVVQKTIFYKKKILMAIGISLGFGILGYFWGKKTYTPPLDYRNLSIEYAPGDCVLFPGFQPDTFELAPYHSSEKSNQFPNTSEDSISQSIP